jgi:hypothetical protein
MKGKSLNIILWVIAVVITLSLVIYQRATGPTYPVKGSVNIGDEEVKFKLIRTFGGSDDAPVKIIVENEDVEGSITLRRYKSHDDWSTNPMYRSGNELIAMIPGQPAAGKVEYYITLHHAGKDYVLTEDPLIIRFKGVVPRSVLMPHIFFMFISLLFSVRVGLEILFRRKDTKYYTKVVLITLFIGGLILGPIVQKYAFDAYWTGWPFGHDLTDNKTLAAFIFWLVAWFVLRKKPENKLWPAIAVIVMLAVYAIPHSMFGSEIDHTKTEQIQE